MACSIAVAEAADKVSSLPINCYLVAYLTQSGRRLSCLGQSLSLIEPCDEQRNVLTFYEFRPLDSSNMP